MEFEDSYKVRGFDAHEATTCDNLATTGAIKHAVS